MIKNFQELVSQIKSQVPIQELISEYLTVKKSGRGFVALCPFHDDSHPSLQIHPQKGIFKCFACGTGGDIFTFYSLINKKKWSEAVPELAVKYGLKVEYGNENKTETQIKKQLYELNKAALDFFKENLNNHSNTDARSYLLNERKLTEEIINKYELGLSLNSWDSLYNYLSKTKNYTSELLIASGLFIPREKQDGYYDRFRNRIIFPIYDENNNVIGFGGRTLSKSKEEAKYINSPETLVFNKGHNLYGLNFAKEEIKKQDYAILTEGYLDVITAHQHGLLNTVATLGTALTHQQVRLLTKFTNSKKIYLCLDSDIAGKKAVESIFRLTQELNRFTSFDIRAITNLPGKDLDESLTKTDISTIRDLITSSQKLSEFILDKAATDYLSIQNDVTKKQLLDETIDIFTDISDPIEQNENIKYLSHRINIDEELINLKIKDRIKSKKQKKKISTPIKEKSDDENDNFKMYSSERFKHAELEVLTLYISSFPHKVEDIRIDLNDFEFIDEKNKLIKDHLDNISQTISEPQEVINQLFLEFNEYKHIVSVITDIAWRIESETFTQNSNYSKNKEKIIKEAKESINWWITNKQKMKSLTDSFKDCKNKEEEKDIISKMLNILKPKNNEVKQ